MKSFKNLFIMLLPLLLFFLIQADFSRAAGLLENQIGIGDSEKVINNSFGGGTPNANIQSIVVSIISILLTFMGIILTIIIMYAGFRWMTAGGNENQVAEAKSWITNAVIGLVIILLSYGITKYVTGCLMHVTTSVDTSWYCTR